jgi:hypothetical protein
MSESVAEYTARLRSYVAGRDPVDLLAQGPKRLEALLDGAPAATLRWAPAPGRWSIAQIAAHLADVELALAYRARRILATPGAPIEAYDQDRWAAVARYAAIDPSASLGRYRQTRAWNLELLAGLTATEWSAYGVHAERGRESIRDMVTLTAGHDHNHFLQIEERLAARAG